MGHDFTELYAVYPTVIAEMDGTFTSHQFIIKLAQEYQRLYVEALYSYRGSLHRAAPTPFLVVHGLLSQHLGTLPELATYEGQVPSVDIFGNANNCAQWHRVSAG
jgi:hypothetical protein